ncbi:phage tail tape measure protein [Klebsiella michiganensis]|nr:phage tail tape measure protein [Klebsiella michiganensis]
MAKSGGNLSDKGYQDELSALENYYSAQDKLRSDWQAGAMTGLANFADEASDLNQLTANAVSGIMNSATSSISSNLTNVLTGATSFKDGLSDIFSSIGQTVIQTLIQMATQALITKAILSSVGGVSGGGLFGSLFSGLSFNAKGGVYDSPSLSAYSNGVYSSPQLFAFAKGAGIFAEAGPEAIMPLAKTAGGVLGVRAIGQSEKVQSAVDSGRERISAAGGNHKFEFINHFNTKPDDAMLASLDKRQRESEKRLVKYLTSQVMQPTEEYGRAIRSIYPGRRMK